MISVAGTIPHDARRLHDMLTDALVRDGPVGPDRLRALRDDPPSGAPD
jgi:hypothetical protein